MSRAGEYGELLDAVRGIRWPARRPIPGALPGAHHSRMRGVAPEFAEYRPYRQGDDPRRLDWRVLARTDRAVLRLSTDRAVLPTTLVVDASASMAFPLDTLGKYACARRLAVALGAVAHAQHDPVGVIIATGTGVRALPPRSRRGVVGEIAQAVDVGAGGGGSSFVEALRRAMSSDRVVLLTDFLGDAEPLLAAVRAYVARGGDAHAVHVVAREELDPPARAITAVDPEDARIARTLAPPTRAEYVEKFARWREELAREWRGAGAAFTMVVDDESPAHAVRRIVSASMAPVR